MSEQVIHILQKHKLRKTKIRQEVLEAFLSDQNKGFSHSDLENQLPDADRVTLYRTLHSFTEQGIVHAINDGSGVLKYALCNHTECTPEQHVDNHAHFHCSVCQTTYCVDSVSTAQIHVPENFRLKSISIVLNGTCDACQK